MSSLPINTVSCSTCRALCCRLEVQLVDDSDDQVPIEYTQTDVLGLSTMKRDDDGWCCAVDRKTFQCTIYEKRPFLCREYQAGDFDCLNERLKLGKS